MFRRMSRLPNPIMIFKNAYADEFLKEHKRGIEFPESYLTPLRIDINFAQVEVFSMKYPYKEFS
jgi:hypothetical protein